jgi:hypothetical protein
MDSKKIKLIIEIKKNSSSLLSRTKMMIDSFISSYFGFSLSSFTLVNYAEPNTPCVFVGECLQSAIRHRLESFTNFPFPYFSR